MTGKLTQDNKPLPPDPSSEAIQVADAAAIDAILEGVKLGSPEPWRAYLAQRAKHPPRPRKAS